MKTAKAVLKLKKLSLSKLRHAKLKEHRKYRSLSVLSPVKAVVEVSKLARTTIYPALERLNRGQKEEALALHLLTIEEWNTNTLLTIWNISICPQTARLTIMLQGQLVSSGCNLEAVFCFHFRTWTKVEFV